MAQEAEYARNPILDVGGLIAGDINTLGAITRLKTFVFALSGALTVDEPKLTGIHPEGISEDELLMLAAHAEYFSSHSIARAIVDAYTEGGREIDFDKLGAFRETMRHGVFADIDGRQIVMGNLVHMYDNNIKVMPAEASQVPENAIVTVIYVAVNDVYAGRLELTDKFRPGAKRTIEELHAAGCKAYLLTGNSKAVAEAAVRALEMDGYQAELEPDDKMQAFMDYKRSGPEGSAIAFVGDGDNDVPYIGLAEVGIAVKK